MEVYFRATPWALPLAGIALICSVILAPRLGRRTQLPPWLVVAGMASLAGFLSVTVTSGATGWQPVATARNASWAFHFVGLSELRALTEPALNVLLTVPLGLAAALLAIAKRSAVPVASIWVVPLLAEGIQWSFPQLGRSAFLLADVVANWEGLAAGMLMALPLTRLSLWSSAASRRIGGHSVGAGAGAGFDDVAASAAVDDGGAASGDVEGLGPP